MERESYAAVAGANDRVKVAVVGCGDRMKSALIPSFLQHAKDMNFEFVAVSDIWNRRAKRAWRISKSWAAARSTLFATTTNSMRARMWTRSSIATADFQHALHGVEAVEAGRDAYVEKPTAHTMDDARKFLAAVKKTGKIVQIGTSGEARPVIRRRPSTSSRASLATS